jgi:hypothetical protein
MTRNDLEIELQRILRAIGADSRWAGENDEFGASIVGMLTYGYGLMFGRTVLFLDIEDIDPVVSSALQHALKFATLWTDGLVAEAHLSAFDREHHAGNASLIGVGHEYLGASVDCIVDNVFSNIRSYRELAGRRS